VPARLARDQDSPGGRGTLTRIVAVGGGAFGPGGLADNSAPRLPLCWNLRVVGALAWKPRAQKAFRLSTALALRGPCGQLLRALHEAMATTISDVPSTNIVIAAVFAIALALRSLS